MLLPMSLIASPQFLAAAVMASERIGCALNQLWVRRGTLGEDKCPNVQFVQGDTSAAY